MPTISTTDQEQRLSVDLQLGTGKGRSLLVVGESPAKNGWIVSGKAFYTPEGKLVQTGKRVNEYLSFLNLTVEQISFTEMTKRFVPERKLLESYMLAEFDHLLQQIADLAPKIVITLGVIPNKVFAQKFTKSFDMGKLYTLENFNYLPLFHPSPANPYGHMKNLEIIKDNYDKLNTIFE